MTCHYRCGDACDKPLPNTSDNPEFADIARRALARRTVLGAAAAGAGALVVGGATSPAAAAPAAEAGRRAATAMGRVRFSPVPPNVADRVTVPEGFRSDVVISWGDPILPGTPAFDVDAQTPAKARRQFGYNNDFLAVLPLRRETALMFSNHEYTNEELMFPTGAYDEETQKRIAMASHGLSVVKLRRGPRPGSWRKAGLDNPYNRRFHTSTPFRVDGPAAGTRRMRTSADPEGRTVLGTLNNCAGGVTPWGTVLSGEENIDQYFEASSGTLPKRYEESYARYGFQAEPERGWGSVDDRFDLSKEPHEAFRFGWIVEVDPYDKKSTPRKHTMLGRFKHEGANVVVSRSGHAVAYMGDDEKGEYLYKFVSADTVRTGRSARAKRRNMQLLTKGTLYVGALTDGKDDPAPEYDGNGHWIPLCTDTESFVDGMSVADVLIDTRLAADTKRATRMDRPEDVDINPVNGRVYACLTNNDLRGSTFPADEPNPIESSQTRETLDGPLVDSTGNRNGYVLEMVARNGNHDLRDFDWRLMLVCGDPEAPETYFAGFPKDKVSPISCPDNVAFDAEGNLWVSTDGNQLGSNDGLFRVPTAGPRRGQVRQFLTVPPGAETCGPVITRDQRTVFVAVQHPGEDDAATFETPTSTWPTGDFPRPSVVAAYQR
jgi:secreted PhoX family phosphatase